MSSVRRQLELMQQKMDEMAASLRAEVEAKEVRGMRPREAYPRGSSGRTVGVYCCRDR